MSERSVRSHLAAMEERGLITREHRYPAERKGKRSSDWTFLAADLAGSAESDHYRQPSVALPATERASLPAASCRVTVSKQEQQEEQGRTPSGDDDTPDELVDAKALCDLLAGRIEAYSGKRPKIRKRWITEMDLLLRRGPTDWATPERISRGEVVSMINRIFDYPDPRSGSTFSWAKNIQSAPTLRDKWEKLRTHEFTPDYQTYDDDTAWMASSATREELGLPLVERS